ncbi:peptide chain release factor N(5)-glutamine methyltransferase [Campylobacter suis]|uniref:peptide chain release factor N(5)-glutamine methyltransferase n=1 Tax=Campylobacter suis TaxID=2790657 RepID=A0ABN7K1X8_9BACT|nr:peptide chain release factor N(5)-glutamine methyltransferase [Campylobacter suis]CAD7286546.1 Release factor glutamine methyltransferase [Campylobacter suis]
MTINEALNHAKSELKFHESRAFVARALMQYFSGLSKEQIYLKGGDELDNASEYFKFVKRFKNSEPLEYITGVASFYSREFEIQSGVLIPRPESEILVEKVSEILVGFDTPRVCEIGVGSGVISVSLLLNFKDLFIIATDINEKALELSRKNAIKFGVSDRLKLVKTSLMDEVLGEFDVIISNPPYIASDYKLDDFVLNEPHNALFGGEKGDEILKQIIALASKRNAKILACEMGYDQRQSMQEELEKFGFEAEFYKDLAGFDRGFVAKSKK